LSLSYFLRSTNLRPATISIPVPRSRTEAGSGTGVTSTVAVKLALAGPPSGLGSKVITSVPDMENSGLVRAKTIEGPISRGPPVQVCVGPGGTAPAATQFGVTDAVPPMARVLAVPFANPVNVSVLAVLVLAKVPDWLADTERILPLGRLKLS